MAELTTYAKSEVDYQAGRKAHPTELNRVRVAIIDTAAAYVAAQNDTFATHLVIPAGSRILLPVTLSCGAGTASTTLSVGLRNALTKVPIDATAILNAAAISSAVTAQYNTGTRLITGQNLPLQVDAEIYGTLAGGIPLANQQVRVEIQWVSP